MFPDVSEKALNGKTADYLFPATFVFTSKQFLRGALREEGGIRVRNPVWGWRRVFGNPEWVEGEGIRGSGIRRI